MTKVVHLDDDETHGVVVSALRVLIVRDQSSWFARGIEIDYAASGESIEDVKRRFERGFTLTVKAHLKKFGTITRLLKWAPPAVLDEYEKGKDQFEISSVLVCNVDPEASLKIPFDALRFAYNPAALAA